MIAKRHTCGNPTGARHFLTQNLTINAQELGPRQGQGRAIKTSEPNRVPEVRGDHLGGNSRGRPERFAENLDSREQQKEGGDRIEDQNKIEKYKKDLDTK